MPRDLVVWRGAVPAGRGRAVEVLRGLVARIDAVTPAGRDRAVDALRGLAIGGVVVGHWLVTGLVVDSGAVHGASPLRYLPQLAPLSWVFQTLAVFFLVGGRTGARGYASARGRGVSYGRWLGGRLTRLSRPVAAVLVVWSVAAVAMLASGAGLETVRVFVKLVYSPLWFLLVFAVLTAVTPLAVRLRPLWPLAVVALVDLARFGLGGPTWLGWINVVAGWLVPYCLGAAWARNDLNGRGDLRGRGDLNGRGDLRGLPGRGALRGPHRLRGPRGRGAGWALLLGGAAATSALVLWAGYPAAMVGVPGAAVSNLNPPTLAAVTFGLAQCGAALLLAGPLRRMLRRPAVWAVVAMVNLSAMTIFLWHQTAMMAVTALGLLADRPLPGLHTVPDGYGWLLARLAWLPAFMLALLVCWAAFHAHERGRPGGAERERRAARELGVRRA
ncbi:acyltransferase family protein [Microtetraspora glauca]|uniref:Acyltransferase n=1 Tax=Microtetraspora glauca TaxID=1996 RepID=A0ABV3G852_MICGL